MQKLQVKVSEFNGVRNQFRITTDAGVYFQSYDSVIVFIEHKTGKIYLDETYWNYSRTTSKHRSAFLGEDTKQTQRRIDSGEYQLVDLN